jgi:hypothetical protein
MFERLDAHRVDDFIAESYAAVTGTSGTTSCSSLREQIAQGLEITNKAVIKIAIQCRQAQATAQDQPLSRHMSHTPLHYSRRVGEIR